MKGTQTRPSAIYLAGPPGVDLEQVAELLANGGLRRSNGTNASQHPEPALRFATRPGWLEEATERLLDQPGGRLILVYRNPVPMIAEAVRAQRNPLDAVEEWRREAEPVLGAFRKARRRIAVVERSAALSHPDTFLRALNERLGTALARPSTRPRAEKTEEHDRVHLLIAEHSLRQDRDARRALSELEASALPLAPAVDICDMDPAAVAEIYHQKSEVPKETLSEQQELKEENELLLLQLHQVQEEIESYFLTNRDLEKEKDRLTKRLADLQRKVDYVFNSRSWKITAPLRAILKIFKGGRRKPA